MARNRYRPVRTVVLFFVGAGDRLRPGRARRLVDAAAGSRPAGRHADQPRGQWRQRHAAEPRGGRRHHRQPGQRIRRLRGRGHHPGRADRGGGDPGRDPPRAGGDRQATGPAAVPGGGLYVGRPQRLWRRRRDSAGPPAAPGPRLRCHRAVRARPRLGEQQPEEPAAVPRQEQRAADGEPAGRAVGVAESHRARPARPPGRPRRPAAEVDEQPRPGVGQGLQRVRVPAPGPGRGRRGRPRQAPGDLRRERRQVPPLGGDDRGHQPGVGQCRYPPTRASTGPWTSSSTGRAPRTSRRSRKPSSAPRSSSRSSWTAR